MGKVKKSRKGKAKRSNRSESPEPEIVGVYKVGNNIEAIVAAKAIPRTNGKRYKFKVQWYGWPGQDTWEPQDHIDKGCNRLLMSFWREIGTFDPTLEKMLVPSQEWIDAEVWYHRKKFVEPEQGTWHSQQVTGYIEETGIKNIYD